MRTTRSGLALLAALVLVSLLMPGAAASAEQTPVATVTAAALNVRQGPGTVYRVIDLVHAGDSLAITGQSASAGWYQVTLPGGGAGWVSAAYVEVAGDLSSVPIATSSAAQAWSSQTTTGGSQIVLQTVSGGPIYAVRPDGTGLRYLTTGIDPALSPDRKRIAFTRWDGQQTGISGSLWIIDVDGTGERELAGGFNQPKSPAWSPDGRQIVLSTQDGGTVAASYRCQVDGTWVDGLAEPVAGARCMRRAADAHWGLLLVDAATGGHEELSPSDHSFAPTWDPANPWHVVYRGDRGLMSLDVVRRTAWLLKENGAQRGPVFSPDGTKIATTFWQTDHWEIHVMNAGGTGEVRLTATPASVIIGYQLQREPILHWNNAAPAWSPDGSQIAFLTDRTGQWEVWVMNTDGSNQRSLLPASVTAGLDLKYSGVDDRLISWR